MLDLAIGDNCHRLQASDALGERRMRAEEAAEKFAGREWRDNAERGRSVAKLMSLWQTLKISGCSGTPRKQCRDAGSYKV